MTAVTPPTSQVADAIVRVFGIDTLVDDHEQDIEVGHKFFLTDGNVFVVKNDLTIDLIDTDGQAVRSATYWQAGQTAEHHRFEVVENRVEMYWMGCFIAAEPID